MTMPLTIWVVALWIVLLVFLVGLIFVGGRQGFLFKPRKARLGKQR